MAYQVRRILEPIAVPESDIITLAEAARLSGFTISGVVRMIDSGKLPELRLLERFDSDRYTLRNAVVTLAAVKQAERRRRARHASAAG